MQSKKLKTITNIILGYTFREAIKPQTEGNFKVILAKDINNETPIDTKTLSKIHFKNPSPTALIKKNDILLSCRGIFRASVFEENDTNIIAGSSIFILRPKTKTILPNYLAKYLNSPTGQTKIQKIVTGSSIKTVLKTDLENLEIQIPTIEKQKEIIEITENLTQQKKILERKIELNEKLKKSLLQTLLTK